MFALITFPTKQRRSLALLLVAVFVAWGVFIEGSWSVEASVQAGEAANPVMARVNGTPIHRDALDREMEQLVKKYKISSTRFASKEAELRQHRNIMDKLVTIELFRQAVHSRPVPDADKKHEEKLREMKAGFTSEEEFHQNLKKTGKTLDALKAELLEAVLVEDYLKHNQLRDIPISQEEMERYYKQNKALFTSPEQIKVRHILLTLDANSPPEAVEGALKKARGIREQIIAGKNFSTLAKEFSACASAPEGGDLGFIARGYMSAAFDAVAFTLKNGEISEPIRTRFGYHIVETLDRKPESLRPFDDVKDVIKKSLGRIKEQQKMAAHLEELRKKAKIELFLDTETDTKRQ